MALVRFSLKLKSLFLLKIQILPSMKVKLQIYGHFGFSDLSSFGREMLYVKVGTDKRKERIWDLRGAVPLWSGNAECKMSHLVRGGRQTQQKKQSANKGKQFHLKGYFLCVFVRIVDILQK